MSEAFNFFGSAIKLKRDEKVGILCNDLVKFYKGLLAKKEVEHEIMLETSKESITKMKKAREKKKIYKEQNIEYAYQIANKEANEAREKKKIIKTVNNSWKDIVAELEKKLD